MTVKAQLIYSHGDMIHGHWIEVDIATAETFNQSVLCFHQMAEMRSVCDSVRRQAGLRREMSELRNAIADIERR